MEISVRTFKRIGLYYKVDVMYGVKAVWGVLFTNIINFSLSVFV